MILVPTRAKKNGTMDYSITREGKPRPVRPDNAEAIEYAEAKRERRRQRRKLEQEKRRHEEDWE
jgi:hypothetical protein